MNTARCLSKTKQASRGLSALAIEDITNQRWYHKTRVIALSCGIKISAVRSFISSQSTCMTDRQKDRNSIAALRGNNPITYAVNLLVQYKTSRDDDAFVAHNMAS